VLSHAIYCVYLPLAKFYCTQIISIEIDVSIIYLVIGIYLKATSDIQLIQYKMFIEILSPR
jgi:type III secretory pathway component EscV